MDSLRSVNSPLLNCTLCGVATQAIEYHHLVPLCFGGKKNGTMIGICSNCHTLIHKYIDTGNMVSRTDQHLVKAVVVGRRAKDLFSQGKLIANDRRPTLTIELDDLSKAKLEWIMQQSNIKGRSTAVVAAIDFMYNNLKRVNK